jgi:hypothetical protein
MSQLPVDVQDEIRAAAQAYADQAPPLTPEQTKSLRAVFAEPVIKTADAAA